jgi:hypothetical protein
MPTAGVVSRFDPSVNGSGDGGDRLVAEVENDANDRTRLNDGGAVSNAGAITVVPAAGLTPWTVAAIAPDVPRKISTQNELATFDAYGVRVIVEPSAMATLVW